MTDTTFAVQDGNGDSQEFAVSQNGETLTPYHIEDATQRTALLAEIAAIVTRLGQAMTVGLPTGAATDAKVEAVRALLAGSLAITAAALPLPAGAATETTLAAIKTAVTGTQAVSAAALPLPAGAATETTLAAIKTAVTGTQAVSAAALPLPAGAATAAKQDSIVAAIETLAPADNFANVTPSDDTALAVVPKSLIIGGAGDLVVKGADGVSATLPVSAGQVVPIRARFVMATGTTATGIVAVS